MYIYICIYVNNMYVYKTFKKHIQSINTCVCVCVQVAALHVRVAPGHSWHPYFKQPVVLD